MSATDPHTRSDSAPPAVTAAPTTAPTPDSATRRSGAWRLIARREIVTRGRSKAYRVTTVVLAILSLGAVVAAAAFSGDDDDGPTRATIGVVDLDEATTSSLGENAPESWEIEVVELTSDEVDDAVQNGDVDVAVVRTDDGDGPIEVVWEEEPRFLLDGIVVDALVSVERDARVAELGLDADVVAQLDAPIDASVRFVDPPDDSDTARSVIAALTIFVMFFAVQMYGSQIAMVVIEEKAGRIVEILLSLVRPSSLLAGKIVGIGVLAALHVIIIAAGLAAALAVSGFQDVPLSAYASLPLLFVVFVLAFAMFGSFFALVGSLVSRQEDAQQAILPATVPIFIGYALSFQALSSPDSTLAQVTAVVPITSPFSLPVITAQGEASTWLIALALALLAITAFLVVRLAARVYEFTLLRTGTRIPLTEALRLLVRPPA